jgi:hypothetical protein
MSGIADERLSARLAGFARAFEAVNLVGNLERLEQDARALAEQLARITPSALDELLTPGDRELAENHGAGFARAAYPLLAELARLGLYRATR